MEAVAPPPAADDGEELDGRGSPRKAFLVELLSNLALVVVLNALVLLIGLHARELPVQVVGQPPVVVRAGFLDRPYVADDEQIVPNWLLILLVCAVPLVVCLALTMPELFRGSPGASLAFLNAYIMTMGVAVAATNGVKNYCGYWRPYYFGECGFDVVTGKCTKDVSDATKSFPSGHASSSMAAMLVTTLFCLGRARLGRPAAKRVLRLGSLEWDPANASMLLCFAPTALALWIGSSRVRENDHHPADVVGGFLLGGACACLFYFRYFPGIYAASSECPRDERPQQVLPR